MPDEIVSPSSYQETENRYPELTAKPVNRQPLIIGGLFALLLTLVLAGLGVWMFFNPVEAAVLRDIFIVFLGFGVFVAILLLIVLVIISSYLVIKVNDLVQLLDREIRPVLNKLLQTSSTVQGTTTFLSDHAVRPVISAASTVAGVRASFRALFRR